MQYLKYTIWWIILLAVVAGSYLYIHKSPCEAPIHYRIGTIDPQFGVTESAFKDDIGRAGALWSATAGKPLFVYDPDGSLTVNLMYDSRQQITQKEQVLNARIDQTSQTAASIKQQYASLKAEYQAAEESYTEALAEFNQKQSDYNSRVDYWNRAGGAPPAEYDALAAEKNHLLAERDSVEQQRRRVNQLASDVNAFIDKYNLLVEHINADVNTINNDGLTGTEFEEGVYISDADGTRITIYQFRNRTDLLRVLAHELGHALQLEHNQNPDSIMNPVNQGSSLTLSPDDIQELKTECGIK